MKPKIFIDGSEGTTGLKIHERLSGRTDIDVLHIAPDKRKDTDERKKLLNAADIVFLCLPDDAARDAAELIENSSTRIIDPSSAHRTADGWIYGLPELSGAQKESIIKAQRLTNPGCHATGAILLIAPLIKAGIITPDERLSITSLTGYTGAGKSAINEYENVPRMQVPELSSPRLYSASAQHKHIPEIVKYSGLSARPCFLPIIDDYPQGMQIIIPLILPGKRQEIFDILSGHYSNCINITVENEAAKYLQSNLHAGSDRITLNVLGFEDQIILTAQFDNLGKGASGAAVQNMNLMLGFDEFEGIII